MRTPQVTLIIHTKSYDKVAITYVSHYPANPNSVLTSEVLASFNLCTDWAEKIRNGGEIHFDGLMTKETASICFALKLAIMKNSTNCLLVLKK